MVLQKYNATKSQRNGPRWVTQGGGRLWGVTVPRGELILSPTRFLSRVHPPVRGHFHSTKQYILRRYSTDCKALFFLNSLPATPHTIHAEMEPGDKSPPKQHTRKRSLADPGKPRAERRVATAAVATDTTAVTVSIQQPRQLADGIASSSASDMPSSAVGSTPPGVMLYFCGQCQKRFRSPAKLAQHERVHTTRDAISCSFCPKQFKYQSGATRRERTHTGEKPYACSMCPMRFAEKSDVAPHERTHTGEKPYGCVYCDKTFAATGTARRHVRTQHLDVV